MDAAEGFIAWARSVELFFRTFGISKENKVIVVSLAFKDSAREWWNSVQTEIEDGMRENISTWKELKEVMSKKYAPQNEMHDFYTQLWNLKQTSIVQEYSNQLNSLVVYLSDLPMRYRVYHFLRGLKFHLRQGVAITCSKTLEDAESTTLQVEAADMTRSDFQRKPFQERQGNHRKPFQYKKGKKTFFKRPSSLDQNNGNFNKGKPRNQEWKKKSIQCYDCGGDHYKRDLPKQKLEVKKEKKAVSVVCKEKNSNKPLYNKVILRNFETFHDVELFVIKGKINGHDATILVDNGCTHNFVSKDFAKKASLKTQEAPYSYEVELANGHGTQAWKEFPAKVPITIQEYEDHIDFDIMKIGRYDAILGQKWLWQYDIHILPRDHILHFHNGKKIKLYRDKESRYIPLVSAVQLKRVSHKTNS